MLKQNEDKQHNSTFLHTHATLESDDEPVTVFYPENTDFTYVNEMKLNINSDPH